MKSLAARFDPPRAILVGMAAAMAFITAFIDATDQERSLQDVAVPLFATSGGVAAALAVIPGRPWGADRRFVTAVAGIVWAITAPIIGLFAFAATACACSSTGPGYLPPEILGMTSSTWIVVTLVGGPILVLVAASRLPDRLRLRRA